MAKKAAPTEEEAPPPAPEPVLTDSNRFFGWMRSLGLERQPGWIGGVCAGIAARLGIDPLIVRGIVVVVAVLGGPALLLYAAAWLLLPDTNNKIHLEELIAGRFESPLAGIGALVLLSLLPLAQGFWWTGAAYWGTPEWGQSLGRVLWTAALIGGAVWLVVWLARRGSGPEGVRGWSHQGTASHGSGHHGSTVSDATVEPSERASAFVDGAPAHPAPGAPQADIDAWREKQAAWKAEREAYRAERAATEQEARRVRAEEARERAATASAARTEAYRQYRLAHPRAGAAFGAITLGAAAVGGAVAAVIATDDARLIDYRVAIALAVASLFIAAGIVGAGLFGRRTGFLNFVAVLAISATLLAAFVPRDHQLLFPGVSHGLSNASPGHYVSLAGNLDITIDQNLPLDGGVIDVWQATGSTTIWLGEGTTTRIEIISGTGDVTTGWTGTGMSSYEPLDGLAFSRDYWRSTTTYGEGAEPEVTIRIWQGRGSIAVLLPNEPEDKQ